MSENTSTSERIFEMAEEYINGMKDGVSLASDIAQHDDYAWELEKERRIKFLEEQAQANDTEEAGREKSDLMRVVSLRKQLWKEMNKAQENCNSEGDKARAYYFTGRADAFAKAIDILNKNAN